MKKIALILLLAFAFFGIGAGVLAFTPIDLNIKPEIKIDPNVVEAYHKNWCEKIQNKIEEKQDKFKDKKGSHLEAYNNLLDRLETLQIRLKNKGYDTVQVGKDRTELEEKIEKFSSDYDTYRELANESKSYACDKTKAELQSKLAEVKAALKTVKSDSKDIKNFYKNVIKPDILQLKKQGKN